MSRNIYAEQGTTITWWVPADCPHNEIAIDATTTWCETCGAVTWEEVSA